MSSIKQVIVNAINKVTTTPNPAYADRIYETADAARDDFVKALLAELFPENPTLESVPVAPAAKKPRAKKAKAAEPVPVVEAVVEPAAEPVAEPVAEPATAVAAEPAAAEPAAPAEKEKKPRKPRAKKVVVEEGSNAAAAAADVPAPEEKEKKARKPKDPDAVKLTAAQVTKAKDIAKTVGVEFDKKAFLAWMGQLTAEERREPLEVMVRAYLSPSAPSAPAESAGVEKYDDLDLVSVKFMDEEYWVEAETGNVFQNNGKVDVKVGMVGQAKFEHMVVPVVPK